MNTLSFIVAAFGCVLMAIGVYGNATDTMEALAIHSCSSEGSLMLIFSMVLHLVWEKK